MRQVVMKLTAMTGLATLLAMTACSTGMEANRPVPVDLSQFHTGDSRFNVVSVVGAPEGSITDTDGPCDIYKLYTTGLGGFGKGVLTAGETITDIGTLGLAEIIWTPVQAGTRPRQHTVMFCYDHSDRLVSMLSRDPSKNNSGKFSQNTETTLPAGTTATAATAAPPPAAATAAPPPAASPAPAAPPPAATAGDLAKEIPPGTAASLAPAPVAQAAPAVQPAAAPDHPSGQN